MGAIRDILADGGADVVKMTSQKAEIVIPPFMKCMYISNNASGTTEVLPQDANKIYVIHGYNFTLANSGATTCTLCNISCTEFVEGKYLILDTLKVTASTVNKDQARVQGLNLPIKPGTAVNVATDAAPLSMTLQLFYSEISI